MTALEKIVTVSLCIGMVVFVVTWGLLLYLVVERIVAK